MKNKEGYFHFWIAIALPKLDASDQRQLGLNWVDVPCPKQLSAAEAETLENLKLRLRYMALRLLLETNRRPGLRLL